MTLRQLSMAGIIALCTLSACRPSDPSADRQVEDVQLMPTPCKIGGEPNLYTSTDNKTYLTWVEYLTDTTDALMFAALTDQNKWSAPKEIARGSDWFVNWADFPSIVSYGESGNKLAAHWLKKSHKGTYDYDIHIAQSFDGGDNWSPSFIIHKDDMAAEHGFVSMIPMHQDKVLATWLDGRYTKAENGAMTLRAAQFDAGGAIHDDHELDHRICDCCQTDMVMTSSGPIIVYRDRSKDEIRDINIVRLKDSTWTLPKPVFKDNWRIAGCPVNGPAVDAIGNDVAVAWFSMPDNEAQVKIAFSEDSGARFSIPTRIDSGDPLGRVDVILLSKNNALVSWVEQTDLGADINLAHINAEKNTVRTMPLVHTSDSRQSGFPVMTRSGKQIILAWTQVLDSLTTVQSAYIPIHTL